jgi:long-chain alkane monooxygenase
MAKEIRLNAFDMNSVGHIQHGMWSHPRDQSPRYTDIEYWQHLARTAERGLFDAIFLADIVGVYDVYGGSPAASIRGAVQIPINDPLLVVPVMAAVTKNIGFGVTSNATYESPYLFARRLSTLDHLTKGRAGWNIVTGYLDSAARAMGLDRQIEHDDRYDLADEYMEAIYKLLERSWEDDAVLADRANRIYADPAKVHAINHVGRRYRVNAVHLSEPSPQRTPVLFQAGVSTRGRHSRPGTPSAFSLRPRPRITCGHSSRTSGRKRSNMVAVLRTLSSLQAVRSSWAYPQGGGREIRRIQIIRQR